jgi:ABC-type multidrug transport system fused ATPase/permease subunit
MLLDEFTSQTDAESESLIHEALREFLPGRTVLVITHRLQTLEIADRILVLDQGKVVALGSHAELMKTNPFYQRFHQHGGGMRHAA